MRLPAASLVIIAACGVTSMAIAETEPGNLWDVTSSMEMSGMKMPGQKRQVCTPVNAEGPEAMSADDRCQMSDIQRSPGRFTYKVQCPDGSGTGEMTYQGKDSYTSKMTMTTDGETMTMLMTGKRVGSCDASQARKQIAAIQSQAQAQAAQGKAQMCAGAVEGMMPASLATYDCDAKYKKQLCDELGTQKGFVAAAERQPAGNPMLDSGTLPEAAKFCGVQPEALRERLCSAAGKADDLDFIAGQCPALAQPIAQRECAGRSFSSPPAEKYRSFCGSYARSLQPQGVPGSEAGDGAPPVPPAGTPTSPTDMMKEGAKRLKGLFGR